MKRTDPVIAAGLSLGSFVLYVRTLAPSLLYGDSAEFQTIAFTLGVGHPTGYPIYILAARLFTFIPVGEIAYRVNLFSAFCASATVGLIYLILRQLGTLVIPSLYGALTLALTSLFWKYASIAEIYTLSAACFALILFSVFQWKETNHPRWIFLAGLLGGLSLGIHASVVVSGIPILVYLVLSKPNRSSWLNGLYGTVMGCAIFLCSFLFLDMLDAPAGYYNTVVLPSLSVWGMTPADFDSPFERLAFLYFPPQFRGQFFAATTEEIRSRFAGFTAGGSSSLALAILGLLSLSRLPHKTIWPGWREALVLALALLFFFGFAITYNVGDFQAYYIPVILLLGILIGLGVNAIIEFSRFVFRSLPIVPFGLSILIFLLGAYPLSSKASPHWRERIPPGLEDWEGYYFSFPGNRKFEAEQIVNKLEDNAIVFTDWDRAYGFYYVAHVLQGRMGMSFHETFPQEGITQFADSAIQYIEANMGTRPIYFDERPVQLADGYKITRTVSGLFKLESK